MPSPPGAAAEKAQPKTESWTSYLKTKARSRASRLTRQVAFHSFKVMDKGLRYISGDSVQDRLRLLINEYLDIGEHACFQEVTYKVQKDGAEFLRSAIQYESLDANGKITGVSLNASTLALIFDSTGLYIKPGTALDPHFDGFQFRYEIDPDSEDRNALTLQGLRLHVYSHRYEEWLHHTNAGMEWFPSDECSLCEQAKDSGWSGLPCGHPTDAEGCSLPHTAECSKKCNTHTWKDHQCTTCKLRLSPQKTAGWPLNWPLGFGDPERPRKACGHPSTETGYWRQRAGPTASSPAPPEEGSGDTAADPVDGAAGETRIQRMIINFLKSLSIKVQSVLIVHHASFCLPGKRPGHRCSCGTDLYHSDPMHREKQEEMRRASTSLYKGRAEVRASLLHLNLTEAKRSKGTFNKFLLDGVVEGLAMDLYCQQYPFMSIVTWKHDALHPQQRNSANINLWFELPTEAEPDKFVMQIHGTLTSLELFCALKPAGKQVADHVQQLKNCIDAINAKKDKLERRHGDRHGERSYFAVLLIKFASWKYTLCSAADCGQKSLENILGEALELCDELKVNHELKVLQKVLDEVQHFAIQMAIAALEFNGDTDGYGAVVKDLYRLWCANEANHRVKRDVSKQARQILDLTSPDKSSRHDSLRSMGSSSILNCHVERTCRNLLILLEQDSSLRVDRPEGGLSIQSPGDRCSCRKLGSKVRLINSETGSQLLSFYYASNGKAAKQDAWSKSDDVCHNSFNTERLSEFSNMSNVNDCCISASLLNIKIGHLDLLFHELVVLNLFSYINRFVPSYKDVTRLDKDKGVEQAKDHTVDEFGKLGTDNDGVLNGAEVMSRTDSFAVNQLRNSFERTPSIIESEVKQEAEIDGRVLLQGDAQAQYYNAENVLNPSNTTPWIAKGPDSSESWFVLDLMGEHTIHSVNLKTVKNSVDFVDLRGRGTKWQRGNVTIAGGLKMDGPWTQLLLEPLDVGPDQKVHKDIPYSRQIAFSYIKVTCTMKCGGADAVAYSNDEQAQCEVWGGLTSFRLTGVKTSMSDQFRLYLHAKNAVVTMPKVSQDALAMMPSACTCLACVDCILPGCKPRRAVCWNEWPDPLDENKPRVVERLEARPGDLTVYMIAGQMFWCKLRKMKVHLVSKDADLNNEDKWMRDGCFKGMFKNVPSSHFTPPKQPLCFDILNKCVSTREWKGHNPDGCREETMLEFHGDEPLQLCCSWSEMQSIIQTKMDKGKLHIRYDQGSVAAISDIMLKQREQPQTGGDGSLLYTSQESNVQEMKDAIKHAYDSTIENSTTWANDVLHGTQEHWIRTTTFQVDHRVSLIYKSTSYPPIEATFEPGICVRMAGAAMAIDFNSFKFHMPAKEAHIDQTKCQLLSKWAKANLKMPGAGFESLEGVADDDQSLVTRVTRLQTLVALLDSYSTRLEARFSTEGSVQHADASARTAGSPEKMRRSQSTLDESVSDNQHNCAQLVYDPVKQAGMLAVPMMRLSVQNQLHMSGSLIELRAPKLLLGPSGQELFMTMMCVNSNVSTYEASTWCIFVFPFDQPTLSYSNQQLILNFENATLEASWTAASVMELQDALGGLACMFPSVPLALQPLEQSSPLPEEAKEARDDWLILRGIEDFRVRIANLYPTLGSFNRTQFPLLPIWWDTDYIPGKTAGSSLCAALWFMITLDEVPVWYSFVAYIALNSNCEYIIDSGYESQFTTDSDHLCKGVQWVLFSIGFLNMLFGLFMMPLMLCIHFKRHSKAFAVTAGFLGCVTLGWGTDGRTGLGTSYEISVVNLVRLVGFVIVFLNALLPYRAALFSCKMKTISHVLEATRVNPSIQDSQSVLLLNALFIGAIGLCMMLLAEREHEAVDERLCGNANAHDEAGGVYILWSGGVKVMFTVCYLFHITMVTTLSKGKREWHMPTWHEPMVDPKRTEVSLHSTTGQALIALFVITDGILGIVVFSHILDSNGKMDDSMGCRTLEVAKQLIVFWLYCFFWGMMAVSGHLKALLLAKCSKSGQSGHFAGGMARSQFALTYKIGTQSSLLCDGSDGSDVQKMPSEKPNPDDQEELRSGRAEWKMWIERNYPATTCYDLDDPDYLDELIHFLWEKTDLQRLNHVDETATEDFCEIDGEMSDVIFGEGGVHSTWHSNGFEMGTVWSTKDDRSS